METFTFIIIVLFVLVLVGNYRYRKTVQNLSFEKQIELREVQKKFQAVNLVVLLVLFVAFILLWKSQWLEYRLLLAGFFAIVLSVTAITAVFTYMKLRENEFDAVFLKNYLLAQGIRIFAILAMLVLAIVMLSGQNPNAVK